MAQPSLLTRLIRYLDYQGAHPSAPFNGSDHDAEHDQIVTVVNQIRANLGLIQRDDTALKNASVHPDSLSTATKALIAATWTPRGLWVTATAYVVGDLVQNSTTSYVCATAHTAGVFATDYAAGKWLILGETAAAGASAVSFSPAGNIAATDVQAAIEELDAEKAPKNGSASNLFSVSDATGANHAVAMQQIQKNSLVSASGTGTGDAIAATITSGLTVLNDGMAVLIEAPGTNSTTTPTFNLTLGATATGAKTVVKGNDQALVAGDIASNKLHLVYDSSLDKWVLMNPLFAVGQATATTESDSIINLGLTFSVGSSALLASVKTALGANPTASDSVRVSMRSATLATGQYAVRAITDSTCTLTISSGSTLGHSSAVEGALHWYLIDNAGTLELAVSSKYFGPGGIVSTSAEGGSGGADSATTMYSASARSNVPFRWIGKTLDTQTTAGTWASTPTETSVAHAPVGTAQIDEGTANQYLRTNAAGDATEWRSATLPTVTVITSGSGTYTPPAGCTHFVVEGWGGGGAGGGGDGTNRGTGGGGGGYFKKLYVAPLSTYSYSVGAAAAAVGQGSGGTAGNGTSFDTCTANGGSAGLVSNGSAQAGVTGGTATGGDENVQGGSSTTVEAAGSGAGSVSYGGDSPRGGFGGKVNVAAPGQIPGGGGSAANGTGSSGAGARGQIVITESYS